ncbi:MAG: hypothetical protein EXS59_00950 [Candidatus Taylorbacteria bacterium]|nr:hypothetical protein [Candidatus Taylorbacteria bacterium]
MSTIKYLMLDDTHRSANQIIGVVVELPEVTVLSGSVSDTMGGFEEATPAPTTAVRVVLTLFPVW